MTTETDLCSVCNHPVVLDFQETGKAVHIEAESGEPILDASHAVSVTPKLNIVETPHV